MTDVASFDMDDLLDAIDHLWGELPVETVKDIERELPGLAELCRHAHHRMSHEQRMVRRPSWATGKAGPGNS